MNVTISLAHVETCIHLHQKSFLLKSILRCCIQMTELKFHLHTIPIFLHLVGKSTSHRPQNEVSFEAFIISPSEANSPAILVWPHPTPKSWTVLFGFIGFPITDAPLCKLAPRDWAIRNPETQQKRATSQKPVTR